MTEFKVGDRVRFKSWSDMAIQYGEGVSCVRTGVNLFIEEMRHLCGTYATIDSICGNEVTLKDFTAKGDTEWYYNTLMIEKVEERTVIIT